MKQVKALKNVIHNGVHKAGHIFKVPDDMDLETARRLVDKKIVTDSIEVLEEPEAVTTLGADVQKDGLEVEEHDHPGTDEPGEEATELGDDTPENAGGEGEAGEQDGEEAVDISTLTKKQIKEELKDRKLSTSGNKDEMYERLKAAVDAENAGTDGSEEAGEGEGGEE